jgi:hypothetical protein
MDYCIAKRTSVHFLDIYTLWMLAVCRRFGGAYASIFMVDVCRVDEFVYMCKFMLQKKHSGRSGDCGTPSRPIGTLHRESYERKNSVFFSLGLLKDAFSASRLCSVG